MRKIENLRDAKDLIQAGFDDNEESLASFGETHSKQLKAYLIESNAPVDIRNCPCGYWKEIEKVGWYINRSSENPNAFILDSSRERIWILYSLMEASNSDVYINNWINNNKGLDRCWLSRNQLLHWKNRDSWHEKGIGLKFLDGLSSEEDAGYFSLKAWYGATKHISGLDEVLNKAEDRFAIYSSRWQKRSESEIKISAEWYSNGKVTINRAVDTEEVMSSIAEMANKYEDAITEATDIRDKSIGAFEIDFTQNIDLNAFSSTVLSGKGKMNLWLVETHSEPGFKRFKGVDLHNWDRIFLDIGETYAYLTIPGKGCVNAAPRIATIQGEDNAGKTSIYFDGVELFV